MYHKADLASVHSQHPENFVGHEYGSSGMAILGYVHVLPHKLNIIFTTFLGRKCNRNRLESSL